MTNFAGEMKRQFDVMAGETSDLRAIVSRIEINFSATRVDLITQMDAIAKAIRDIAERAEMIGNIRQNVAEIEAKILTLFAELERKNAEIEKLKEERAIQSEKYGHRRILFAINLAILYVLIALHIWVW